MHAEAIEHQSYSLLVCVLNHGLPNMSGISCNSSDGGVDLAVNAVCTRTVGFHTEKKAYDDPGYMLTGHGHTCQNQCEHPCNETIVCHRHCDTVFKGSFFYRLFNEIAIH